MIELTFEKTVQLLREAVAERGEDFVYEPDDVEEGCTYVHRGDDDSLCPGCLVGDVLIRAGVPAETFIDLDINKETGAWLALEKLKAAGLIDYDRATEVTLHRAQLEQDEKQTWGDAMEIGIIKGRDTV